MKRWSKYNAKRTVVDGFSFASRKESVRYGELKLMQSLGDINSLILQPKYQFPMGFSYIGDFEYRELNGKTVCEDVKGFKTAIYKIKLKCMKFFYPKIELREI